MTCNDLASNKYLLRRHICYVVYHHLISIHRKPICKFVQNHVNNEILIYLRSGPNDKSFFCQQWITRLYEIIVISLDTTNVEAMVGYVIWNARYVCGVKIMKDKFKIARHILIHTGEKPYSCSICTYACNQKYTLKRHFNSMHC